MTDETIARTSNSNRSSNDPSAGSAERVRTERTGAAGDTEAAGPQVGAGAVRTSKSLAECSPGPLVREIATAYESGFGHGVAGRGPLNPYVSGSFGAEAWEYGHWCGTKRRAPETFVGTSCPTCKGTGVVKPPEPLPNDAFRWICIHCTTVNGIDDPDCLGCRKPRYPHRAALKANERAPEVCGCPYGQCNCNDGSENEKP